MNILLIGCGRWGKHYLRKLLSQERIQTIHVVDPDQTGCEEIMDGLDKPPIAAVLGYMNLNLFGDTKEIDAAIIASHANTHFHIAQALLNSCRNIPILIEKPVVTSLDEFNVLNEFGMMFGAHQYRSHPAYKIIENYVLHGLLGKVVWINTRRTHFGLVRKDVSMLGDLAPHDIDVILRWMGGGLPEEVSVFGNQYHDQLQMVFDNGMSSSYFSWASQYKRHQWEVYFERGCLFYDDYGVSPGDIGRVNIITGDIKDLPSNCTIDQHPTEVVEFTKPDLLQLVLDEFLSCVEEKRGSDLLDLATLRNCVFTLESAIYSKNTGQGVEHID